MVEKVSEAKTPSGCSRWLFRLPIRLYQAGLGWLLGGRFVSISHTGRVTGRLRQVVLEVVKSDAERGVYYVVAAWGERADWFKNIQSNPTVRYQVGSFARSGCAEVLSEGQAAEVFVEYGRKHPRMLQSLMRIIGYRIERDEASYRALAGHLPVVRLAPDDGVEGR